MLKKMLGKKKEESSSSSSESDNEGDFSEPRKQKKSSLANLKSKFDGSPKEGKGSGITTVKQLCFRRMTGRFNQGTNELLNRFG